MLNISVNFQFIAAPSTEKGICLIIINYFYTNICIIKYDFLQLPKFQL